MMKFIHLYILKLRLARIFKLAEQHAERGVESGEQIYVDLFAQAQTLIHLYERAYPDFNVDTEIPAINDLARLTVPTQHSNINRSTGITIAIFGSMVAIGTFAAGCTVVYQGWIHLFHLIVR